MPCICFAERMGGTIVFLNETERKTEWVSIDSGGLVRNRITVGPQRGSRGIISLRPRNSAAGVRI